ncbi:MAG: homocysteine S-methyltransferase family protein [Lachnospiraceae bacterium]|nr:homocysteine S-methyltransferase family protein [Lachnospiraceae bacterium]
MTKQEFRDRMKQGKLILDGATGSNLQERGMPTGVCPEEWILEHRDVLRDLQVEYILAGSDAVYAPTFSGNRLKLAEYGLQDRLEEMNRNLVGISREAISMARTQMRQNLQNQTGTVEEREKMETVAERPLYVVGDLTMTGQQVEPMGPLPFEELVDIYRQQIRALDAAGVDLLVVETMMSLQECRAAVIAAGEVCDLPVMVTLTFDEDGRTLFGTDPETAALVMTSMGVDAVGVNCSTGPDKMCDVVRKMTRYADVPVIAKPNAGLPSLQGDKTVYDMDAPEYAEGMMALVEAGADILGGCCGTTPEHIAMLTNRLRERERMDSVAFPDREGKVIRRALSNERKTLEIDLDGAFLVIGERINPTGKKALQAQLREGSLDLVTDFAEAQEEAGAAILDVNMGMNGIDEQEMMLRVVRELSMVSDLPLSIDSSYVNVVEEALRIYPGRALINSISLEQEKFEKLIPVAKKYGAMFILLPLSDQGLPKDLEEKKRIIHTIMDAAVEQGLRPEDIVVDGLVATVGANPNAARETLETIRYCKQELGLATACGLSNISFGLPERSYVNSSFMALAIGAGLTMAIANPSQDLLMHTVYAADLLMNKPEGDLRYIDRVSNHKITVVSGEVDASAVSQETASSARKQLIPEDRQGDLLFEMVVRGRKNKIQNLIEEALKEGKDPQEMIDDSLIPAINYVGELFERQTYFLPQLIASAETMEQGIGILEPILAKGRVNEPLATVVIATVEHDIHDIGKNLVALMLRNYGYRVIDLGKDVPAEEIVDTAERERADIIGLSALMTTTMMEMKKVGALVRERGLDVRIMIGGAVITQGFADEIGADGYSKDAQEAVVLAARLMQERSV